MMKSTNQKPAGAVRQGLKSIVLVRSVTEAVDEKRRPTTEAPVFTEILA